MKTPKELALLAARALSDKKGAQIQVLEIGDLTTLADYFVLATGYGRNSLDGLADLQMSELSCHAKGATFLFPQVHTVVDIGGQDVKILQVENGVMNSTITSVLFHQVDIQWTSMPLETMSVKSGFSSNDKLCVVGNTACAYYSSTGEMLGTYNYNGTLVSADLENGKAALIIQDDQKRNTSLVLLDQSVSSPKVISIDSSAELVRVFDGDAIVMSPGNITSYAFSGDAIATVKLEGAYTSFLKQDGYLFLLGYDQIDRVDFKE